MFFCLFCFLGVSFGGLIKFIVDEQCNSRYNPVYTLSSRACSYLSVMHFLGLDALLIKYMLRVLNIFTY